MGYVAFFQELQALLGHMTSPTHPGKHYKPDLIGFRLCSSSPLALPCVLSVTEEIFTILKSVPPSSSRVIPVYILNLKLENTENMETLPTLAHHLYRKQKYIDLWFFLKEETYPS